MSHPKTRLTDTSLWLHNKLGTSNDLWSGGSICSQLNQDVLRNIRDCFNVLQSQVKLKLLLSFLHIPRRNIEEWKVELDEILEIALEDSDQWVSMVAELLKKYPSDGTINFDIDQNSAVFTDLVSELKKIVRKHGDKNILPLECLYLNKNALNAQVGHVSQPQKHFTLKRKPKSAALRAELLQKSSDAASSMRKPTSTTSVPIRCRGLNNDSRPMIGIPRIGFKTPNRIPTRPGAVGSRKDGGIKILDINEQPVGLLAKRKKVKEDKEKEDKNPEAETTATPDYAAGLTSMIPPSPAPAYAPQTPASSTSTHNNPQESVQNKTKNQTTQQKQVTTPQTPEATTPVTSTVMLPMGTTVTRVTQLPQLTQQQPPQNNIQQHQPQIQQQIPHPPQNQQQQAPQPQRITIAAPSALMGPGQKLSLTKEQVAEAQDMFRNANKVTKPEKALIIGFMGGVRDNPCPQLGNVVTIKLSENMERVMMTDGTIKDLLIETHYQMNYATGEGRRIRKAAPQPNNQLLHQSQGPSHQQQNIA